MNKKKVIKNVVSIIVFLAVVGVILYSNFGDYYKYYKLEKEVMKHSECLKKYYEVPDSLNVIDIVSENELLVKDDQTLSLQIYDLEKQEFKNKITVSNFDSAKSFEDGVVWVETCDSEEGRTSKVMIKYFSDDSSIELDNISSDLLPRIAVGSNYLTYIAEDNNNIINVKLYDLEEKTSKVIASYEFKNDEKIVEFSEISASCDYVVWSISEEYKSNVYRYYIKSGTTDVISEENHIDRPVVKGDRVFAVNEKMDESTSYNHDNACIVEYDSLTNKWVEFTGSGVIKPEEENVTRMFNNEGHLYWSSISNTDDKDNKHNYYMYDSENNIYISPKLDKDLYVNVLNVKNNVVHYEIMNSGPRSINVIYVYK